MECRNNDHSDPHRRRLDAEAFAKRDQRIWRMRQDGHTIQEIADAVDCGLASVDRALKRLVAAQKRNPPKADHQLNDELNAVLAKCDDEGLKAEEVTRPEQVETLNELELFGSGTSP